MARIFITGDVHAPHDIHKLNPDNFPIKNLTKDDILIICGDAGFVWTGNKFKNNVIEHDSIWIKWISKRPWTTVYVDGNHENHKALKSYPVVNFHGAKAHKISDSLFHIMRGEIMTLNGKTFFCFGGAFSHDRALRTKNIDWWQEELPIQEEVNNALDNLAKYNNQVDYIITHDVSNYTHRYLGYDSPRMGNYDSEYINICSFLENIRQTVTYQNWFAGHYHINKQIEDVQILYDDIAEVFNDGTIKFLDNNLEKIWNMNLTEKDVKDIIVENHLYYTGRKLVKEKDILKNYPEPVIDAIQLEEYFWKPEFKELVKYFLITKGTEK